MSDAKNWKVAKWPFLLGDALLLAAAWLVIENAARPITDGEAVACVAAVAVGAILGALPFILDYRAIVKVVEANALGAVSEKIQNLERLAGQITTATNQWDLVQGQADKTSAGAREIAEKMAAEVREFSAFMQKMNDSEKSALRLEVEKFRRAEAEWLRVLARILDHVFVLHTAALRSGQPKLAEQITQFQKACHDAAHRIGLAPFIAAADEPFNAERHQLTEGGAKPPDGAFVAETVGPGYTFQGKLVRPALVRLRGESSAAAPGDENSPAVDSPDGESAENPASAQSPD
jgi:molecular chaperone GrpE (heat shock protein)